MLKWHLHATVRLMFGFFLFCLFCHLIRGIMNEVPQFWKSLRLQFPGERSKGGGVNTRSRIEFSLHQCKTREFETWGFSFA